MGAVLLWCWNDGGSSAWCHVEYTAALCHPNSYGGKSKMHHGPLTRYAKLWVAHAPGMPGTFSPPRLVSDPAMHHGTCLTHVPWCMAGSLTNGFLWNRRRGKRSRHSRRMRNPQFCVSGKRPITLYIMSRNNNDVIICYTGSHDRIVWVCMRYISSSITCNKDVGTWP